MYICISEESVEPFIYNTKYILGMNQTNDLKAKEQTAPINMKLVAQAFVAMGMRKQ
jgi:hypothetical protein